MDFFKDYSLLSFSCMHFRRKKSEGRLKQDLCQVKWCQTFIERVRNLECAHRHLERAHLRKGDSLFAFPANTKRQQSEQGIM